MAGLSWVRLVFNSLGLMGVGVWSYQLRGELL